MAKLIKETPILKGKDARRFWHNLQNAIENPISKVERDKIKESYDRIRSIATFDL